MKSSTEHQKLHTFVDNDLLNKIKLAGENLRHDNGLYSASAGEHYRPYVWLRDLYMQTLNLPREEYLQSWTSFLNYLVETEKETQKFTNIISNGKGADPLHIRWSTFNNSEIEPEWGHLQFDAWGMSMIAIAKEAEHFFKNEEYKNVIKLMIQSVVAYRVWEMPDTGAWEENHEVRQSSIACIAAGLHDLRPYFMEMKDDIDFAIHLCSEKVFKLGTNETETRSCDLAQTHAILTCIPRDLMSKQQALSILENIEKTLLREKGVIRYENDLYYNINCATTSDKYNGLFHKQFEGQYQGAEAEWVFGLPKLILCRKLLGLPENVSLYERLIKIAQETEGNIPELYYANTNIHNDNTPLGWACNLTYLTLKNEDVRF